MGDTKIVVLAGGQGSRFWPISRLKQPKQFLSISDSGESLLQATVRRVTPLASDKDVWVLSNELLQPLVAQHCPTVRVICEPVARNTAACIGFAAIHASIEDPNTVMVILPADHAVGDEEALRIILKDAIAVARHEDYLVTVGVTPTHPHTGYGYIKRGAPVGGRAYRVDRFFEKPSYERAEKYCESREYSWNSGMFVWRANTILEAMQEFLPDMHAGLMQIRDAIVSETMGQDLKAQTIDGVFRRLESISIDFGVLEHARNGVVIEAEPFGWNDVGSWDQWAEHFAHDDQDNLIQGDALLMESKRCVVHAEHRFVAVVGAEDMIVIDAGDALLVCSRNSVQEVRKVVDELRRRGRTDLV